MLINYRRQRARHARLPLQRGDFRIVLRGDGASFRSR